MQVTINSESLALLCGAARLGANKLADEQLTATLDAIGDAEAIMREARESDPEEPCRIRCVTNGRYAENNVGIDTGDMTPSLIHFGFVKRPRPENQVAVCIWPRRQAVVIARALIALSGDYGIEIEPANG